MRFSVSAGSVAALLLASIIVAPAKAATLDIVRERGTLICADNNPSPGFAQPGKEEADGAKPGWSGFDVNICQAVAAAIFGDPGKVDFRVLQGDARFAQLQNGEIDLIARNSAWTMRRDTEYGASYVATSFFDGQAFMVPSAMGVVSAEQLDNVSVCVVDTADNLANMRDHFFKNQTTYTELTYEDREDLGVAYKAGRCNVISASASWLYGLLRTLPDPVAHRILPERISREPLGPVVREGDEEWFNIVRWTLFALVNAEELGITQLNLDEIARSRNSAIQQYLGLMEDFGAPLRLSKDWMRNVIRAVGNYGEIYDRNFGPETGAPLPRGFNGLWKDGGKLYAPPIR